MLRTVRQHLGASYGHLTAGISIQWTGGRSAPRSLAPRRLLHDDRSSAFPASFLRGGTSKGVFFTAGAVPGDQSQLNDVLLRIMGSPDSEHCRQLNGMGGGVSSLSKAVIVSPASAEDGADVRYQFAQIGIKDAIVDYSGNCGNLTSMVGPFAMWAGLCAPRVRERVASLSDAMARATVRAFNVNTSKLIDITFPVRLSDGLLEPVLDLPEVEIAGVPGRSSRITLDFLDPGGARTGKLLPTGRPVDLISAPGGASVEVSLVDATNPTVLVDAASLSSLVDRLKPSRDGFMEVDFASRRTLDLLEHVRRQGASLMGLDPSAQAQPKITVLSSPANSTPNKESLIVAHTLSMGVLHRAIPMTVGLCLGVAAHIPDTVAWRLAGASGGSQPDEVSDGTVRIQHPSGVVDVGAVVSVSSSGDIVARSAKVIRTGKRLMNGHVWT